jgi:hypothetical protein
MSQTEPMPQGYSAEPEIGAIEALRLGWEVATKDFWAVWVVGLVYFVFPFGAWLVGNVPYIGGCF